MESTSGGDYSHAGQFSEVRVGRTTPVSEPFRAKVLITGCCEVARARLMWRNTRASATILDVTLVLLDVSWRISRLAQHSARFGVGKAGGSSANARSADGPA